MLSWKVDFHKGCAMQCALEIIRVVGKTEYMAPVIFMLLVKYLWGFCQLLSTLTNNKLASLLVCILVTLNIWCQNRKCSFAESIFHMKWFECWHFVAIFRFMILKIFLCQKKKEWMNENGCKSLYFCKMLGHCAFCYYSLSYTPSKARFYDFYSCICVSCLAIVHFCF